MTFRSILSKFENTGFEIISKTGEVGGVFISEWGDFRLPLSGQIHVTTGFPGFGISRGFDKICDRSGAIYS